MNDTPDQGSYLNKLPQIDKDSIQAVRNFLPGKVLGRTAAVFMLMVTVLAWAGAVDIGLKKFFGIELQPPWVRFCVLFGLPLLIVTWQLFLEWEAARNQRQAKRLALTDSSRNSSSSPNPRCKPPSRTCWRTCANNPSPA